MPDALLQSNMQPEEALNPANIHYTETQIRELATAQTKLAGKLWEVSSLQEVLAEEIKTPAANDQVGIIFANAETKLYTSTGVFNHFKLATEFDATIIETCKGLLNIDVPQYFAPDFAAVTAIQPTWDSRDELIGWDESATGVAEENPGGGSEGGNTGEGSESEGGNTGESTEAEGEGETSNPGQEENDKPEASKTSSKADDTKNLGKILGGIFGALGGLALLFGFLKASLFGFSL